LLERIRARLADGNLPRVEYLVLDFRRATGFDASTVSVFQRIQQLCEGAHLDRSIALRGRVGASDYGHKGLDYGSDGTRGMAGGERESESIQLVFAQLSDEMRRWVTRGGLVEGPGSVFHLFEDLDHAVEWCEERILAAEGAAGAGRGGLHEQLARVLTRSGQVERFQAYLQRLDLPAGYQLFAQGDLADALYFVDSGSVTAQLELGEGRSARLRTILSGTVVGEAGVYLGRQRTATVVTAQASTLYRLTAVAMERMEVTEPDLAAALHHWVARLMADRLAENNAVLAALLA